KLKIGRSESPTDDADRSRLCEQRKRHFSICRSGLMANGRASPWPYAATMVHEPFVRPLKDSGGLNTRTSRGVWSMMGRRMPRPKLRADIIVDLSQPRMLGSAVRGMLRGVRQTAK